MIMKMKKEEDSDNINDTKKDDNSEKKSNNNHINNNNNINYDDKDKTTQNAPQELKSPSSSRRDVKMFKRRLATTIFQIPVLSHAWSQRKCFHCSRFEGSHQTVGKCSDLFTIWI